MALPRRHALRLSDFDYTSSGAYFITICAYKKYPLFTNITLKQIIEEQWNNLPQRFPSVALDSFMIMPDHLHFIIWLGSQPSVSPPSLAQIIRAFKSLTSVSWSRHLRSMGNEQPEKIWQERYYEHIIRNEHDLDTKRRYIQNNPIVDQLKKEGETS